MVLVKEKKFLDLNDMNDIKIAEKKHKKNLHKIILFIIYCQH